MRPALLDCGPVTVEAGHVAERLGLSPDPDLEAELGKLAGQASRIARPRAVYLASFVEERSADQTVIDGVRFHSRVLGVNLREIHRVFPFVVTAGLELETWSEGIEDPLMRFRFPAEGSFESCMLCPREACPNRRAAYDAALFESRYKGALAYG